MVLQLYKTDSLKELCLRAHYKLQQGKEPWANNKGCTLLGSLRIDFGQQRLARLHCRGLDLLQGTANSLRQPPSRLIPALLIVEDPPNQLQGAHTGCMNGAERRNIVRALSGYKRQTEIFVG